MIAATPLEERIAEIISPAIGGLELALVRIRVSGGNRPVLQIMAERADGTMDVGTCARLSREISAVLDVEDPISQAYSLEVSSPGIDRPLTRLADFGNYTGHLVKCELRQARDGRKRWQGILAGVNEDGEITLQTGQGEAVKLAFGELASARLVLTDQLIALAHNNTQET